MTLLKRKASGDADVVGLDSHVECPVCIDFQGLTLFFMDFIDVHAFSRIFIN
jgi:hypothetical protein